MMPAGGSMEMQMDTPWGKLLEFLVSVGVNIADARDADIHISAGATDGAVMVTNFVRNPDGRFYTDGNSNDIKTEMKTYTFHRPEVVREPRLVQEEVPDV